MKYWTVQTKNVIDIVHEKGIFQPDFNISHYLNINANLKNLYYLVLKSFNTINDINLPGLIYAFAQSDGTKICPLKDINEFCTFIKDRKAVIDGFWKKLNKKDVVIVELIYNETFNPIFIDINDFQFIMPPIISVYPYTKQSVYRIYREIQDGKITASEFPSNVIQAHLPYIKPENILNNYPIFDLN